MCWRLVVSYEEFPEIFLVLSSAIHRSVGDWMCHCFLRTCGSWQIAILFSTGGSPPLYLVLTTYRLRLTASATKEGTARVSWRNLGDLITCPSLACLPGSSAYGGISLSPERKTLSLGIQGNVPRFTRDRHLIEEVFIVCNIFCPFGARQRLG